MTENCRGLAGVCCPHARPTCRKAIKSADKLLIMERELPELGQPGRAAEAFLLDLEMLVMMPGGRERTGSELAKRSAFSRPIPSRWYRYECLRWGRSAISLGTSAKRPKADAWAISQLCRGSAMCGRLPVGKGFLHDAA